MPAKIKSKLKGQAAANHGIKPLPDKRPASLPFRDMMSSV
jgi:hypothetical protein